MKHLLIILFALWGANVTAQTPQCVQNNLNSYLSLNGQEIKSETWSINSNPFGITNPTQSIRLNEDLVVPSGVDLTIDGLSFEFGTLGRIIVESGATLNCLNSYFLGDPICETMWQGIQVAGPGINSGPENNHLKGILNMDNCEVRGAIIGVANMIVPIFDFEAIANGTAFINFVSTPVAGVTGTPPNYSLQNIWQASSRNSAGGELVLTNNSFANCFEGVSVCWKSISNSSNIFTGNLFYQGDSMNYPFDLSGFPTISLSGINGMYVENMGRIYNNEFYGSYYGIRANGVDKLFVNNCLFVQNYVGTSVRHYFNSTVHQTQISDNNYNSCYIGMQFDGCDNTIISNNMVTNVNPLNGFCNGPNCLPISASVGIVLRGSDFAMKDNNIHEVPYPIVLIDNDSDGSYMLRNTSMNSDISVMAFGDNTGVQLKCNNLMDYNLFGIFINGYSITGEAGDLGAQGDCGINDFPSNVFSPSNGTAYDIFFTNNTNTLYYEDVVLPTSIGGNTANFNGVLCTPPIGFNTNIYCNNLVLKPLDEIDDLVSEDAKNKALSEWIFEYVKDSNFIAIKDLILSQNTLMTERKRIPEKLIEAELDVAQILLDQMLVSKEEDHWYKQYYQLMLDVQQAERSVFELTEDELVLLENIANSRTKTAFKAQALLFIIQGKIFLVDLPELPDGTLLQTVFKTETNLSQLSEEEKTFNVFPNPVKDQITLDFNKVKNGKIQLIDVLGKTVLMKNIYESKQEILDVSMLGIGIYFIQIQLDNKEIAIQKIIINR